MAGGSLINDINMSFMGQMTLALGKLSNLEGFVKHVMAHEEANIVAGCS
jgi:hypothetical protein